MQEIRKRNKGNGGNENEKREGDVQENGKNVTVNSNRTSSKNISLRVFSRVVVISSLLIVVYFSSKDEKVKIFARQSDLLAGKGQVLDCSPDYIKGLDKYEGCFPKECKRFVTDKVISMREIEDLITILQKGLRDSSSGITILDLDSGALSNGLHNSNIYKTNDALFGLNDFNVYRVVKEKIKYAISHHFGVEPSKIYLTRPALLTVYKEFSAKISPNEYWHPIVDHDIHNYCHYTALLHLSDYDKDFKGGRFIFVDDKVNKTIEPRKGRLTMFTSGGENRYFVEKITSGIKYSVKFFFTCTKQHAIEDPSLNKYVN